MKEDREYYSHLTDKAGKVPTSWKLVLAFICQPAGISSCPLSLQGPHTPRPTVCFGGQDADLKEQARTQSQCLQVISGAVGRGAAGRGEGDTGSRLGSFHREDLKELSQRGNRGVSGAGGWGK